MGPGCCGQRLFLARLLAWWWLRAPRVAAPTLRVAPRVRTLQLSFLPVIHDPCLAARCDRVIELNDARIERDEAVIAPPNPQAADAALD